MLFLQLFPFAGLAHTNPDHGPFGEHAPDLYGCQISAGQEVPELVFGRGLAIADLNPFFPELPKGHDGFEDRGFTASVSTLKKQTLPSRLGKRSATFRNVPIERLDVTEAKAVD